MLSSFVVWLVGCVYKITLGEFENKDVHFLDLKTINNVGINIYVKNTNSGFYINYNSYELSHTKSAWIRELYDRAQLIKYVVTSIYSRHK